MTGIIGRNAECATIAQALTAPGVGMILIEGEPGIGKSTLWQYAVTSAREHGHTVLQARPGRAEVGLTYAALTALLPDPLLDKHLPALPEPRRQAIDAALLRAAGPPVTPVTLGLAVVSLLLEISREAPLVLAVDDIQWIDAPTAAVLEFALRRVADDRILLLSTRRTEARHEERSALEAVFEPGRLLKLTLGPMSVGALGALIRERLGHTLPRLRATKLHECCGGNPLLAQELVRALPGGDPAGGPGESFPVSADAPMLIGQRIVGLPAREQRALLFAALAFRPTLELFDRLLGPADAADSLATLADAGLVRVEANFVHCGHPLIASAASTTAPPAKLREVHRALAAVAGDTEQRARHLALGADAPDETVAHALDAAAAQARQRGATDAAAELAELAVRLTPADELPTVSMRQLTLARYRLDAGHTGEAETAATQAVELLSPGPQRVDALLMLAAIAGERSEREAAQAVTRQALAEAGDDPITLARAHIGVAFWGYENNLVEDLAHAQAALDLLAGDETRDPKTAATALLTVGGQAILTGGGIDLGLLDRAVDLERLVSLSMMERPSTHRAIYLGHAGRYGESIAQVEACLAAAEAEGDWPVRPHILRVLGWFEYCLGHFGKALSRWEQAAQLAEELGLDDAGIHVVGALASAAVGGDGDALAARALARSRAVRDAGSEVDALKAQGFCALTAGRPADAVGPLSRAAQMHHGIGIVEPGWHRLHGDWIESLVVTGDLEQARHAVDGFLDVARSGRHPWTQVASARCAGLVAEAEGQTGEAIRWMRRSLAADPMGAMRFERARTLTALGRLHRRTGQRRAARLALAEATGILQDAPSPPWAAFATAELATVSGRSMIAGLTNSERRVVDLVIAARSNKEIATELHLSIRTVESHLASAYRKLGVRSRTELAVRSRTE